MFKLEHEIDMGVFLAPKCYYLKTKENIDIIKHKGPSKGITTPEWYINILKDHSIEEVFRLKKPFKINWQKLEIREQIIKLKRALPKTFKRDLIFEEYDDGKKVWIDTNPVHILEYKNLQTNIIMKKEQEWESKKEEKPTQVTQETQKSKEKRLIHHNPDPGFGNTPEEWLREAERIKKEIEDYKKKNADAIQKYIGSNKERSIT